MKRTRVLTCAILFFASAVFAHTGVKNAAVKARMDAMSGIGAETKTLGEMAKGKTVFDQTTARAAFAAIAKHAAATPALFEAEGDDPKSEAKPAIWSNLYDFVAKSRDLEKIAIGFSTSITSENELAIAIKSLGSSCQACHKAYRE